MEGKHQQQQQQGVVMAPPPPLQQQQNPLVKLQERYQELEVRFRAWLAKQHVAVEAAVVTLTSGAQGGAIGAIMGTLTGDLSSSLLSPTPPPGAPPEAMDSLKQAQALAGGPLVQARNFAVMTGVNAGIACVLKRIRGVEDVQSSMAAAFGSGVAFSLVSGMGGPNQAANAFTSGLFFALIQGGIFQFSKKFTSQPSDDIYYAQTKNMLRSLGLEQYTKNFKKGMLTDQTLHLLTDSALQEVRVPPGPRLVILDHIRRDNFEMLVPITNQSAFPPHARVIGNGKCSAQSKQTILVGGIVDCCPTLKLGTPSHQICSIRQGNKVA